MTASETSHSDLFWALRAERHRVQAHEQRRAERPDRVENLVGPVMRSVLQSAFDGLYPAGLQWYWRADFFNEISDAAIDVHLKFGEQLPTGHSTMHLYPIDGAASRVLADATAFAYRNGGWAGVIVGVDPNPARTESKRPTAGTTAGSPSSRTGTTRTTSSTSTRTSSPPAGATREPEEAAASARVTRASGARAVTVSTAQ